MPRRSYSPSLELLEDRCVPASFTVWNTRDEGMGSFRQAILNANEHANRNGPDQIVFRIPSFFPPVIRPLSALPAVVDPVVIDGGTQPGFLLGPRIVLDGRDAGFCDGLRISGGGSTVRSLAIGGFAGAGLRVDSDGNVIEKNHLGTNRAGTAAFSNEIGLVVSGKHNRIGTNGDGVRDRFEGNVISGNRGPGVVIVTQEEPPEQPPFDEGALIEEPTEGEFEEEPPPLNLPDQRNLVAGNRIGADVSGTLPLGNGWHGQARLVVETRQVNTTVTVQIPITVCDEDGCHTEYRTEERQVVYAVRAFDVAIEVADSGSVSPGVLVFGNANVIGGPGVAQQDRFQWRRRRGGRRAGQLRLHALHRQSHPGQCPVRQRRARHRPGRGWPERQRPGRRRHGRQPGPEFPHHPARAAGQDHAGSGQPAQPAVEHIYPGLLCRSAPPGAAQVATNASGIATFDVFLAAATAGQAVTATATDIAGNTSELSLAS